MGNSLSLLLAHKFSQYGVERRDEGVYGPPSDTTTGTILSQFPHAAGTLRVLFLFFSMFFRLEAVEEQFTEQWYPYLEAFDSESVSMLDLVHKFSGRVDSRFKVNG